LRVFSRSEMLAFRSKSASAPQVGQELGAAFVLEGTIRRAGQRLRVTASLVETRTRHSVWAKRFDRQMEDVFAIQDEIAHSIADALQVVLSDKEKEAISKPQTADVRAYDYYLRGRQFFHQWRRKGIDFAKEMFARAIEIDPNYARAYAGLADCYSSLYTWWEATEANMRASDEASRRAMELDPKLAEAHVSRGLAASINKRYDEMQQAFETAIRLNPKLFEAYYFYARSRFAQGKMEEAADLFQKASEVFPEDYQSPALLALVFESLGRKTDAKVSHRRAIQIVEKHLELHPDDARALVLGSVSLARLGERGRSSDWAARALAMAPDDSGLLYNVACTYSLLGFNEKAIDCLNKAIDNGFAQREWIEHDSDLEPLRKEPGFDAVLKRL
jgi:adenylate cyclase